MKQKVAIARTVLHDPPILILDEPSSGLDVPTARLIENFMLRAKESGKCILFSTHVMEEAEYLCDRIGVVHQGKLRALGTMDELRELTGKQRLREIFLDLLDIGGTVSRSAHMNLKISAAVYQKEMLEIFRDRRTMISMVVVPLLAIPLLFSLINGFMTSREKEAKARR